MVTIQGVTPETTLTAGRDQILKESEVRPGSQAVRGQMKTGVI